MTRLGLTLGLESGPARDLEICREAEELGYTDLWSAEVAGADGLAVLAAAAAITTKVRLGTAIVPVFTRPPALLAMGAATVQQLSGGRFVLGVGTSSSIIIERWMGTPFDKPLTRLREYVELLRAIFSGKKTDCEGETVTSRGFRLDIEGGGIPIYVAALGPRACRMAGEIADGVIFFLKSPDGVRQALGWVEEGARAAGRDPDEIDRVIRIPVAMDEDEDVVRLIGRRQITGYAMVDVYNRSLSSQGFDDEMRAVSEAWSAGKRDEAAASVSDRMLEELQIFGDADTCRRKLDVFRAAGITTPVLFPFSVAGDPEERTKHVRAAVAALAPG